MRNLGKLASKLVITLIIGSLSACGGGGGGSTSAGGTPGVVPAPAKPLEVLSSSVPNGAQAVDPRARFVLTFNGALGAAGLASDQVQLSDGSKTYAVTTAVSGSTLTVTPLTALHTRTDYRLVIKAGAADAGGAVLKTDYALTFKTLIAVFETQQLAPRDQTVFSGREMPRIIIADVNGDSRRDLVELAALNRPDLPNGYTLNIYVQNAAGAFNPFQKIEFVVDELRLSKYFNNLIVLDTDGDKQAELLVPEFRPDDEASAGIRVFKAGADGKFAAHAFIATNYTQTLQALDVDGDGRLDLVGSNRSAVDQVTGGFQVLLGTQDGFTKLAPVPLQNGGYEFGAADLDQDGKRELIVNRVFQPFGTGPMTNELLIFSQGDAGAFSKNSLLTGETSGFCTNADYCRDMKIADLNVDGKPELVFGAQTAATENLVLAFSREAGKGLVKKVHVSLGYDAGVFGVQDMDGDHVPDLLVVGAGFYAIVGGEPDFSLEFSNQLALPVVDSMYPANVAIGDVDGDGDADIVFDSYNSGIVMARQVKY